MTTAQDQKSRASQEDFEAWSKNANQGYDLTKMHSGKLHTYEDDKTEHAWRGFFYGWQAARTLPAPDNVRAGEPYDNPAFEDLARTMGVWGTAQSAMCAQFFLAGRGALPADSSAWLPTAENVNALPEGPRLYIHALEVNADPSCMVRENAMLRDANEGLQRMFRRAKDALDAKHAFPAGMEPVAGQCRFIGEEKWKPCAAEHVRMVLADPRYAAEGYEVRYVYTAAQVRAMGRVPPGWQAVPVEPTEDQMNAARDWSKKKYGIPVGNDGTRGCYAAMLASAPQPPAAQEAAIGPCGQCKDVRQPCQCSLDTILKERGLMAVNRESFQHMVTKIAAASAPACWCAACDSAASPFGIPTRMSLCPKCGDKRCPRAQHHDSDCSAP